MTGGEKIIKSVRSTLHFCTFTRREQVPALHYLREGAETLPYGIRCNIINTGRRSLSNVIHHTSTLNSQFSIVNCNRTNNVRPYKQIPCLPCELTPQSRLCGDPIIGEVAHECVTEGLSPTKCDLSHLNYSLFIIHYSFIQTVRHKCRPLRNVPSPLHIFSIYFHEIFPMFYFAVF